VRKAKAREGRRGREKGGWRVEGEEGAGPGRCSRDEGEGWMEVEGEEGAGPRDVQEGGGRMWKGEVEEGGGGMKTYFFRIKKLKSEVGTSETFQTKNRTKI
jgi:hypothetical protein